MRGVYEHPKGSGVWWIHFYDAYGKRRRQKIGRRRAAESAYRARKKEVLMARGEAESAAELKVSPPAKPRRQIVKYGLTEAQQEAMWNSQGGRCGVCGDALAIEILDHCHRSGRARGFVCSRCNLMLSFFEHLSPEDLAARLKRLWAYLAVVEARA